MINDEISESGTVHVNSVNNVHNHENKPLNCFYVNASLVSNLKIDELNSYVVGFDLDIIGITETWLNEWISGNEGAIENFSMCRKDRSEVKGRSTGVIVHVRESVLSFPCDKLSKYSTESVWCKVMVDKGNLLTNGVCYKSPSADEDWS